MRACTSNADCIGVISVCCGCGASIEQLTAVNRRYEMEYAASIGCEPGVICDGCLGPPDLVQKRAECVAGVCEGGVIECASADDCLVGNGCSPRFSPSLCSVQCVDDTECRAGEICRGGCTTPCTTAADCTPGGACMDSFCRPYCIFDRECRDGESCTDNACTP
jgi:hypothetical protein